MKLVLQFFQLLLSIALLVGMNWQVAGQSSDPQPGDPTPGPGLESVWQLPIPPEIGNIPVIDFIQITSTGVVVHVQVPHGVKKVTLESRARAGVGTWVPRAVQRAKDAGELTFHLSKSASLEMIRVRADAQEPLPTAFYQGKTNFNGPVSTTYPYGAYNELSPGGVNNVPTDTDTTTRTVAESDIWSLRGNTLYFFNQYRGLQIIDLTLPDAPVVSKRLNLPAAGEQMYVMDTNHVVLLVQNSDTQQVVVVDVSGTPRVAATIDIEGYIQESRMVGTALYLASQTYRQTANNASGNGKNGETEWEWGTVVTSIDLASPEAPVKHDSLWYSGYGNVVVATDKYLLVAYQTSGLWNTSIGIIDISAPDGTMNPLSTLPINGFVADKFKMNITPDSAGKDVLAVVLSVSGMKGQTSAVQTFSLADPTQPAKLGYLEIGKGESLYATRFDSNRVYIVTYLRIDPLWIVDLKDPANPQLLGELQVPGWSTYMYPMGDRLVTIGIDNSNSWKVAVSLFDVSDPAKPGLLSKVPLGDNYSWSEANNDEKAFTVLPDAGLILVPYQTWSSNDWASSVQLIDLSKDSLKARGTIEHSMQPRRATLLNDRIVSISGRELLVVDAKDRDHPVTTATVELSWAVNRVFVAGNYLVEVENSAYWAPNSTPAIRVVTQSDPDTIVTTYSFTNGFPVVGAGVKEGKLYVLQGQFNYWGPIFYATDATDTNAPPAPNMFLSVFDLGALPALPRTGYVETVLPASGYFSGLMPLWPKPGLLVWAGQGGWAWPIYLNTAAGYSTVAGDSWMPFWRGGGGSGELIAYDVANTTAPKFASDWNLAGTNGWWNFGTAFTADGLIYSSHQMSEFVPGGSATGSPSKPGDTNSGVWVTHYYLDVVDYADPANPTQRNPVNLPAYLAGVSTNGALLYTKGSVWDEQGKTDGGDHLEVCAYDGVQVSLIDSVLITTNVWSSLSPQIRADGTVLIPVNEYSVAATIPSIQGWKLGDNGKLANLFNHKMGAYINSVGIWDSLLGVEMSQAIEIYNITNILDWTLVGRAQTTGYAWPDLGQADGNLSTGLVAPLGDYGILSVPILSKP